MDIAKMNIYQKILAIQSELQTVAKNLEIATKTDKNGKTLRSYKAVSEVDILNAVKPLEAKYGVVSFPAERTIVDNGFLEKEGYNGSVTKSFYLRVMVTYTFVNVDSPTEQISVTAYGDGIDTGDKATGKAMTYADKYALMKMYKISTGDDPDQERSEEYTKKTGKPDYGTMPMSHNIQTKVKSLYTEDEIKKMLANKGVKDLSELTTNDGLKMIEFRQGIGNNDPTF